MDESETPHSATTWSGSLSLSVSGFANEETGRLLGEAVAGVIFDVGNVIDLSTLDGVTVALDYDAALAAVDRGIEGMRPLSRSNTEEMQGVAMSPAVMRDGKVLTHLVFNAAHVASLVWRGDDESEEEAEESFQLAVGIISHECAHVQITAEKERSIPEARLGTRIEGYQRAVMFPIAEVVWDEYAACRLSSGFNPQQNARHAETVIACATVARERCNAAIIDYRTHGDINRLVAEAGPPLCQPVKGVAYLLGGMDGAGAKWSQFPDARTALDNADYGDLVDELREELRRLWDTRGCWAPDLSTFKTLEELATKTFDSAGMYFHTDTAGQCRIDVPFTPETMP